MFNENSSIVKNYVLLIKANEKTVNDVPNYSNLREVVSYVIEKSN